MSQKKQNISLGKQMSDAIGNNTNQEHILEAIRNGDTNVFAAFYLGYAGSMVKLLTKILGNKEDAEEVTQDVFAYIWENRVSLDPHTSLKGYVAGMGKYMALRVIRERNAIADKHNDILLSSEEFAAGADDRLITEEMQILVERTVRNMPAQRRKVFEMSREEGLTYNEIANRLNISYNTVKFHMQAALVDIRSALAAALIIYLMR